MGLSFLLQIVRRANYELFAVVVLAIDCIVCVEL